MVVAIGASLVKAENVRECIERSDALLERGKPEEALAAIDRDRPLARAFSPYFRALHCNAVRCYTRLSAFAKAEKESRNIYEWHSHMTRPSGTLLVPVVRIADNIVIAYLRSIGTGSQYDRWSGYRTFISELKKSGEMGMLKKVSGRIRDLDPENDLAEKTIAYIERRKRSLDSSDRDEAADTAVARTQPKKDRRHASSRQRENPYRDEYVAAKRRYVRFFKKTKELRLKRDRASGSTRVKYEDQLRQLKRKGIRLQQKYEAAARRYKEWEKKHSESAGPAPGSRGGR
jgi:hypothetical protein